MDFLRPSIVPEPEGLALRTRPDGDALTECIKGVELICEPYNAAAVAPAGGLSVTVDASAGVGTALVLRAEEWSASVAACMQWLPGPSLAEGRSGGT